jgi:hypothetical protein
LNKITDTLLFYTILMTRFKTVKCFTYDTLWTRITLFSVITFMVSGLIIPTHECTTYYKHCGYVAIQALILPYLVNIRYDGEDIRYDWSSLKIRYKIVCSFILSGNTVLYIIDKSTNNTCFSKELNYCMLGIQLTVFLYFMYHLLLSLPNKLESLFLFYATVLSLIPFLHIVINKEINRWLLDLWIVLSIIAIGIILSSICHYTIRLIDYYLLDIEKSNFIAILYFYEICTTITYFFLTGDTLDMLVYANCSGLTLLGTIILTFTTHSLIIKYKPKKKIIYEIEMMTLGSIEEL